MASLLGSLTYAGLATLLTTQASLGSINAAINLYSIATGISTTTPPDVALFQPSALSQGTGAIAAGVGWGGHTLSPILYTRSTNGNTAWYNPNTTAMPGDVLIFYPHSYIR